MLDVKFAGKGRPPSAGQRRLFTDQSNQWKQALPPKVAASTQWISKTLRDKKIPHAFIGGVALNVHGFHRATQGVDILLSPESLVQFQKELLGRGISRRFTGAMKKYKDTDNKVDIDVVLSGEVRNHRPV